MPDLRVQLWAEHKDGCSFYRLEQPARVLADNGYDVETRWNHIMLKCLRQTPPDKMPSEYDRVLDILDDVDADVVVYQRPMYEYKIDIIKALQRKGIAVVVELDDDFHNIDPDSRAFKNAHPHWHLLDKKGVIFGDSMPLWAFDSSQESLMSYNNIAAACEVADLVTVTTPALAELYGKHGRVAVLPNLVPESYLDIGKCRWEHTPDTDFCMTCGWEPDDTSHLTKVGWTGSVETHPGDLEATYGAVADVLNRERDAAVYIVGSGIGVAKRLGIPNDPLTSWDGIDTNRKWVPIEQYPYHVAKIDVGMVPLKNSTFNEAKSCLKGMEMAATGVPFVASPRADYVRLHRLGVGDLADTRKDWRKKLVRLVSDSDYRREKSEEYREKMRALTYEQHAEMWWTAWELAAEYSAMRRVAA